MEFNKILLVYSEKQTKNHLVACAETKRVLNKLNKNFFAVSTRELTREHFRDKELIITVGGDGTFVRATHFLKETPIVGINSDPESSAGVLTNLSSFELEKLSEILNGKYLLTKRQRAQVIKKNKLLDELVLNEIYLGARDQFHTSRYIVNLRGNKEEHRSSGAIISTGSGSTGWYKSAGGEPFHPNADNLMLIVREPTKNRVYNPKILNEKIELKESIFFESLNRNNGVIAIDGETTYEFNFGDIVEIRLSNDRLNVLEKLVLPSRKRENQKRVALFGGSFNPIHNSHLRLINQVLDSKIVDELWIIPCNIHAFNKDLLPADHRIKMIDYAIKEISNVRIDCTEVESVGVNFTFDTIKALQEKYPHKFYLLIGSDLDLKKWYKYPELFEEIEFILQLRSGHGIKNIENQKIYSILNEEIENISSTTIREKIKNSESISHLVPKDVEDYILKNNLYRG